MMRRSKRLISCVMILALSGALSTGCSLFGGKSSTPGAAEPAPVPKKPTEIFAYALKGVLSDAYTQSQRVGTLQFDLLLDPSAKPDPNKSSSTHMAVNLVNQNEPDKTSHVITDALQNAATGDASFVIALGEGQEQGNTGGVYFVGDKMTIKRGNTDKKMVQYPLSPEQKIAYKPLTAMERLTRTMEGDASGTKAAEQWQTDIDGYLTLIAGLAVEGDYAQDKATVNLMGKDISGEGVTLTLGGDKASQALKGMISLLKQNAAMNGIYDGIGAEDSSADPLDGLQRVLTHVEALTPEQVAALTVTVNTVVFDERPLSFNMKAVAGDQTLELSQMFYTKGYERHHGVSLKDFDGSAVLYLDKNAATGGDNYAGETSMAVTKAGGIDGGLSKAQWTSVNKDSEYSAEYTYAYTFFNLDEGVRKATNTSGKLSWNQKKASGGDVTGAGKGEFLVDDEGEKQVVILDITLDQKYGDVTVSAPEFIPSAGIATDSRDSLMQALEVDTADYEQQPFFGRIMQGLAVVAY